MIKKITNQNCAEFRSTKPPPCSTVSPNLYVHGACMNAAIAQIFVDVQLRGTLFTGYVQQPSEHKLSLTFKNREGGQQGEVETAVAGTVRLQSDSLVCYFRVLSSPLVTDILNNNKKACS